MQKILFLLVLLMWCGIGLVGWTSNQGGGGGGPAGPHAATHSSGGSDPVTVQNLSTGAAPLNTFLTANGTGGSTFDAIAGYGWSVTTNVSTSLVIGTAPVTITASVVDIPQSIASKGHRVRFLMLGTQNVTTSVGVTLRLYLGGVLINDSGGAITHDTSNRCWINSGQIHFLETAAPEHLFTVGGLGGTTTFNCATASLPEPPSSWGWNYGFGPANRTRRLELTWTAANDNPGNTMVVERFAYAYD